MARSQTGSVNRLFLQTVVVVLSAVNHRAQTDSAPSSGQACRSADMGGTPSSATRFPLGSQSFSHSADKYPGGSGGPPGSQRRAPGTGCTRPRPQARGSTLRQRCPRRRAACLLGVVDDCITGGYLLSVNLPQLGSQALEVLSGQLVGFYHRGSVRPVGGYIPRPGRNTGVRLVSFSKWSWPGSSQKSLSVWSSWSRPVDGCHICQSKAELCGSS